MRNQELYINNVLVELKDDLQTYLNYRRSDISNPDKKQWDFSYSITLPGSKTINKLFGFLFEIRKQVDTSGDVNFQPDFNPNLKAECVYFVDTVENFRGVANLKEIRISHDRKIEYDLVLYGKFKDIINSFGEDELANIVDVSEYDHAYTIQNIEDSWSVQIQRFGVPYVNFQGSPTVSFPNGPPSGEGYVYPLIDYGFSPNLQDFNLVNLYPSLYEKTILDKVFAYYGFTYGSVFLNGDEFKTTISPFTSPFMRLNSAQVLDRKFQATKTANTQLSVLVGVSNVQNTTIVFNNDSTNGNFDTSAQYNNATGFFTVGTGLEGTHSFTTKVILTGQFTPDTPGISVRSLNVIKAFVQLIKIDINNVVTNLNSAAIDIDHTGFFTTNYETANPGLISPLDFDYVSSPFNPRNHVSLSATNVNLISTDRVFVRVTRYAQPNQLGNQTTHVPTDLFYDGTTFYNGDIFLNVKLDSVFYNNIDNTQIVEGQTVLMNNTLPQKVKVKDWFMSLVKKFNLQIEPDKDIPNKINIETYDDFYTDEVVDWSDKVDISQDIKIIPMGALDAKRYLFKDKDDTDYYNQRYKDGNKRTYGEREISVINDFVTQVKTTETIFSPTPSAGSDYNDRVIPRIIKVDQQNQVTTHEANLRILYYGGLKTSNAIWKIFYNAGSSIYGKYPYAGHLDDPFNPTMDLNFGIPFEIYWRPLFSNIVWTNANAYNRFWKTDIEERIDRNSKIVEVMMRLKPTDIFNIDFRKTYFFKDEYFRLLNIVDYNPRTESLTKCIFIKRKQAVPFTADTQTFDDTILDIGGDEQLPTSIGSGSFNNNTGLTGQDVIINGSGNRVADSARNVFISGDNNTIGEHAKNINLFSSSGNLILGGVTDIVMVNTFGKRISENNMFLINGQAMQGPQSIKTVDFTGSTIERQDQEYNGTYFVDCTGGPITLELEEPEKWIGLIRYYKKIDASANAMTIDGFGTATIDGSLTQSTTTQYDVFGVTSDGSNYFLLVL